MHNYVIIILKEMNCFHDASCSLDPDNYLGTAATAEDCCKFFPGGMFFSNFGLILAINAHEGKTKGYVNLL